MKNIFLFLFTVIVLGCKKDNIDFENRAYGISFTLNPPNPKIFTGFVEINLNNGNINKKSDVFDYEELANNQYHVYSRSENLYIYGINTISIGIINTKNLTIEKIDLSKDTTLIIMRSILLDDDRKKLFVIEMTDYPGFKRKVLSVIPINLLTKKIEPKFYITSPNDTLSGAYISEIDIKNQRIFIKQEFGPKTYIFDYNLNKTTIISTNVEFLDLNYDAEKNRLFGITVYLNDGIYLESYFLESGEIRKTLLKDVSYVMTDCKVFNKKTKDFWVGVDNKSDFLKMDMIKIDINSGDILQKITLSTLVSGIN